MLLCKLNDDSQSKETIRATTIQVSPTKAPGELRPINQLTFSQLGAGAAAQLGELQIELFKSLPPWLVSNLQISHSTKYPAAIWPWPAGDRSHDPMQHSRSRYHNNDQHHISANLLLLSVNVWVCDIDMRQLQKQPNKQCGLLAAREQDQPGIRTSLESGPAEVNQTFKLNLECSHTLLPF